MPRRKFQIVSPTIPLPPTFVSLPERKADAAFVIDDERANNSLVPVVNKPARRPAGDLM
jgi:hypothetical protein